MHLEAGGTLAMVISLAVLLAGGPGGHDGRPFEEVVVERFFVLGVEVALIGRLCEDGDVFIPPQFLQISDVRHDNFIRQFDQILQLIKNPKKKQPLTTKIKPNNYNPKTK